MFKVDSLDKIIGTYFAAVAKEPFNYKKRDYLPRPLRVSPGVFRDYTCPSGCGGCCFKFSLDYLPTEEHPYLLKPRRIVFDGRAYPIHSDLQEKGSNVRCGNLRQSDGRCGIYERRPFSCDFELIRFSITAGGGLNHVNQRLFGRGWSFERTDGGVGAKCEMLPADTHSIAETIRKLHRLREWTNHFELATALPEIIEWAENGPRVEPLFVNQKAAKDGEGQTLWLS